MAYENESIQNINHQICLLSLNFPDYQLLLEISDTLNEVFKLPVIILDQPFSLEKGKNFLRNQYNSNWILYQILQRFTEPAQKVLAVTTVDLYVHILTYVFGEAQVDGKAAVVSIHRLRNELYGLPKNQQMLKERLEKEAIHELGHTFGLLHCYDPNCVMYSSTYAEEIDAKSKDFCDSCCDCLGI